MASAQFSFFSTALARITSFRIILPNDVPVFVKMGNPHYERPTKVLFLLHGYSGCDTDWLYNAPVQELSGKYNLAIVLPNGENAFYLDAKETGRQYGTFIGEELVNYVRTTFGLSDKAEDTFIGGYSMGGFGALHTALAYNHTFGKAVALSSALIIHQIKIMEPDSKDGIANYEYYKRIFGDLAKAEKSENNPEVLVSKILENNDKLPEMYLAIGTEDFLYEHNQIFKKFLEKKQVEFEYHEGPGAHDFVFWNQHLEPSIQWLLK